jgi:hypothetical protein
MWKGWTHMKLSEQKIISKIICKWQNPRGRRRTWCPPHMPPAPDVGSTAGSGAENLHIFFILPPIRGSARQMIGEAAPAGDVAASASQRKGKAAPGGAVIGSASERTCEVSRQWSTVHRSLASASTCWDPRWEASGENPGKRCKVLSRLESRVRGGGGVVGWSGEVCEEELARRTKFLSNV